MIQLGYCANSMMGIGLDKGAEAVIFQHSKPPVQAQPVAKLGAPRRILSPFALPNDEVVVGATLQDVHVSKFAKRPMTTDSMRG